MARLLLFLGFCMLAGLGPVRSQVLTSIPASTVDDAKSFWGAVMEEFYGPYSKRSKCWIGKAGAERLCMRPHLLSSVMVGREVTQFAAMSGHAIQPDGSHAECHGCAGKLGLVVLRAAGNRLALVARNSLFEDIGSWGMAPPEEAFRVVRLGKDNYGWLVESGFTGQGYTQGGVSVFGVLGDKVVDLGFIDTYSDNEGTCGDGLGACYRHSYEIVSDAASGSARFADLVARKLESSDPDATASFTIPFSNDELKYLPPEALSAQLGG
ncbi:hypothetical protein [Hoeflea sp.]|uniref:hypothetical protein n=1 Tax=Hoeflea sp. TaxID=1940281 RepID=UPI003A8E1445